MSTQIADYGLRILRILAYSLADSETRDDFLVICSLRPTKARQIKFNLFAAVSLRQSFPVLQMQST